MRRIVPVVAGAALLLSLSACTATSTPAGDETYASASDAPVDPAPSATPQGALDPDVVLVVKATGVAANGARLALELRLHRSIAFDDVGGQTLPTAVAEGCPATLNPELFATQSWSFSRANISALLDATSGLAWPADARIGTSPSGNVVAIVARGLLADDAQPAANLAACARDKSFVGQGNGAYAFGLPGDTAGGFTGWASQRFGFTIPTGETNVKLTDCTMQVTDLGKQYGGGTDSWTSAVDDATCVIGATAQTQG
jgi:hypothetical protein